ncbi:MAG: hypothetical protein KJI69_01275 [Patescibacteria group bacterium]|nr:hypothetical protein [Patescibacteria group bacterium]
MNNLNITKTGNVVGILSTVFFLFCMAWGLILTAPELKELHLNILRIVYPGFSMSIIGATAGIVASFIYGWLFGALFAWLCNKICIEEENK